MSNTTYPEVDAFIATVDRRFAADLQAFIHEREQLKHRDGRLRDFIHSRHVGEASFAVTAAHDASRAIRVEPLKKKVEALEKRASKWHPFRNAKDRKEISRLQSDIENESNLIDHSQHLGHMDIGRTHNRRVLEDKVNADIRREAHHGITQEDIEELAYATFVKAVSDPDMDNKMTIPDREDLYRSMSEIAASTLQYCDKEWRGTVLESIGGKHNEFGIRYSVDHAQAISGARARNSSARVQTQQAHSQGAPTPFTPMGR